MNYTTVIFDLDGTILYTLGDLTNSVNFALRQFSFPERTVEEVRQFVGNGVERLVRLALPCDSDEATFESVFKVFKAHYSAHCCDDTRPYNGICEVMQQLKERGVNVAILSNKFHSAAVEVCEHYFHDLYDLVVGEGYDDGVHRIVRRKPSADGIDVIIDFFNVRKQDVVLIGDSEVDFATSQNAGIAFLGACWGYRDKEFLKDHGVKDFVETAEEVILM